MSGFIKLFKKITEWEWYGDPATRDVFIHLLLIANWKPGKYQGVDVPRGAAVVSIKKMADELGFSYQRTRTALEHLISTSEITSIGYPKFTVITVVNYENYQGDNEVDNEQVTSNQRANNEQVTTIEEYKEYKNTRREDSVSKVVNLNNSGCKDISTTTSCSEPKVVSEPEAPVEIIPLNDGTGWRPPQTLYAEYVRLYPNVDLEQQFRAMRAWCLNNPTKLKTRRGIKRFVGNWLDREQNRPRQTARSGTTEQPPENPRERSVSVAHERFLQRHPEYRNSPEEMSYLQRHGLSPVLENG